MRSLIFIFLVISTSCIAQSKKGTVKIKKVPVDTVYSMVEVMPQFTGGETAFLNFINMNVKYPPDSKEAGQSGTSFVTCVINKDGTVSDVTLFKGAAGCVSCDLEALRVFRLMPPWQPGMKDGVAVRVRMNLPLRFSLR